jgi:hypothetical protein
VNTCVLLRPPDNSRTKKQMPKVGILGDKYSIQDLLTHKVIDTHVSNLSEFKYVPSSSMQPIEVAARNAGEFFVEKIIDHNGLVRNRKDMSFQVRWKGYSDKDDT